MACLCVGSAVPTVVPMNTSVPWQALCQSRAVALQPVVQERLYKYIPRTPTLAVEAILCVYVLQSRVHTYTAGSQTNAQSVLRTPTRHRTVS